MNGSLSNPESISRFKKERYLLSLTEDKFRDEVARPLLLRQGLKDGRDVCGVSEKGKDAIFFAEDKLGMLDMYVVQTKKGHINMSRKASENVVEAITQLKTALQTSVSLPAKHKKQFPAKAFLCVSGKVNDNARSHIVEQVGDPRIVFLDSDELIPKIDSHFPEVWLGIDADIFPYLREIRTSVESATENMAAFSDTVPEGLVPDAATDSMFVQLRLHRSYLKPKTRLGTVTQELNFEDLPVTGILSRKERLVLILGEAGSGKSTSIKRLAYLLAEKGLQSTTEFKVPVVIRATDVWASTGKPLVAILEESTKVLSKSVKSPFTLADLNKGNVTILLDALDELANDDARMSVLETVSAFHQLFPQCQIIVTSRDYSFIKELKALKNFTQFRLSAINYKQAEQILKRFEKKKSLTPEKANEILRRIQEVHGLELNPLLVTVFAATADYARKDIPANITELFKKYTEMMLGRWNAEKGVRQQFHAPLKDFLLKKIAYEMHVKEATSISLQEFKNFVQSQLSNRGHSTEEQLLEEMLYRSGLLRVAGDVVEFRHLLIQEFFAGRGIPSGETLKLYVVNEWWQRALVFYFGEHPADRETFDLVTTHLVTRNSEESMTASVTIGLGLQACYLLETSDKLLFFPWVIENLSKAKDDMVATGEAEGLPMTAFLRYYLMGRDAVACNLLIEKLDETLSKVLPSGLEKEKIEVRTFWVIVGLIEAGDLKKAKELLKQFKPSELRLLLGIHLGCFLIERLRVVDKEQRALAKEICGMLAEPVGLMRGMFVKEFKSQLLELRQGKIKEIEDTENPSGAEKTEIIDV